MNDPVMGGRSTGTFEVDAGIGNFTGEVVDVPFLQAPGFIQARTVDHQNHVIYPDLSSCQGLMLTVTSNYPTYEGYRFSFGRAHPPNGKFFAFGYKTSFSLQNTTTPTRSEATSMSSQFQDDSHRPSLLQTVRLPFSSFTDLWDDATGDPIRTCQEDPQYCPTSAALRNLSTMAVWAEGVAGKANLCLHSIQAYGCSATIDAGVLKNKDTEFRV